MDTLRAAAAFAIAGLAGGCGGSDPNAELKELVAAAETAAEERDGGFFRDLIAPGYRDERGRNRDELLNLIRGYLLAHSNIEIITYVDEIVIESAEAARVVVRAGMAGQRAGEPLLGGIEGQLYRIELKLSNDDSWRVTEASWQPAMGR
jgi:hypothetical protein